jgi:hypothetical protein
VGYNRTLATRLRRCSGIALQTSGMLVRRRDIRRGVGVDVSERCLDAPADQRVTAVSGHDASANHP